MNLPRLFLPAVAIAILTGVAAAHDPSNRAAEHYSFTKINPNLSSE